MVTVKSLNTRGRDCSAIICECCINEGEQQESLQEYSQKVTNHELFITQRLLKK